MDEARRRAHETLARLAARDADRALENDAPADEGPADEPSLTEQRRAFKAEQRAAEAARRAPPPKPAMGLHEIIRDALESFGRPLAARLKRMETDFAAYMGRRFGELRTELTRHVDDELSAAIKDVRQLNGDLNRQAERLAQKAADRATVELRAEVRELRKELAELRAEKSNVRALR